MTEVSMNKNMKLSEHLASPSEAALSQTNELDGLRLSPHFTLGELTKTSYYTTDGNIPSRVAIENLKNICENWLEDLRYSYNVLYGEGRPLTQVSDPSFPSCARLPVAFAESRRLHLGQTPSELDDIPIVISSGYRSEEVNRKCGGAKGSNHLMKGYTAQKRTPSPDWRGSFLLSDRRDDAYSRAAALSF